MANPANPNVSIDVEYKNTCAILQMQLKEIHI